MQRVLNGGVLPGGYYALAEQVANQVIPDVLPLQDASAEEGDPSDAELEEDIDGGGVGVAVAEAPPRVAMREVISEAMLLAARRRRLVIRHATGDRIVAFVEIVSPGNKEKQGSLDSFVDKAVGALNANYHLLLMDLFPPRPFDPTGIHGAIWQRLGGSYEPPAGKPLTLAGYAAEGTVTSVLRRWKRVIDGVA